MEYGTFIMMTAKLNEVKNNIEDINENGWKYLKKQRKLPLWCNVPVLSKRSSCHCH
ncbi:hypothetical protein [Falsibacillus pallidus]|uniref:Uncharacterized protein n=1 Tax=Falsibacillus pallidus TaxID=493781 RepID=A0A370GHE6_9BACI|nr:hypothetical protein [Falsibacillus pallidus]RDI43192.1 hypothetical protein DFR59_104247 [Falsibacillus pallidus]